jgi:hypothetical protein
MTPSFEAMPSFSLVLHGWDQKFPFENLLQMFEAYFARAGAVAQYGDIVGENPPEMKSYSFRTIRKRIQSGEYRGLSCLSLLQLTDKQNKTSEDFAVTIKDGYGRQEAGILNAVSGGEEARQIALDFLRDILGHVSPYYGYSLEMPLGHYPLMYASGVFGHTEGERDEATSWQEASRDYLKGFLFKEGKFRLVFEINVLSPPHMVNRIGDTPFAEWVSEPGHGRLEQWKEDVWVWFVPKEDRIRCAKVLQFNGLLTAPEGFENELIG